MQAAEVRAQAFGVPGMCGEETLDAIGAVDLEALERGDQQCLEGVVASEVVVRRGGRVGGRHGSAADGRRAR
jgi:hypothetical protein